MRKERQNPTIHYIQETDFTGGLRVEAWKNIYIMQMES